MKSISNDENRLKRINVQKIASLKDILNKPIQEVTFDIKSLKELDEISKCLNDQGHTLINISFRDKNDNFKFKLKNKRNLDRKNDKFTKK